MIGRETVRRGVALPANLRSQLPSPKGQPAARSVDHNGTVEEAHRCVARGRRCALIASGTREPKEYRECRRSGTDDDEPMNVHLGRSRPLSIRITIAHGIGGLRIRLHRPMASLVLPCKKRAGGEVLWGGAEKNGAATISCLLLGVEDEPAAP